LFNRGRVIIKTEKLTIGKSLRHEYGGNAMPTPHIRYFATSL